VYEKPSTEPVCRPNSPRFVDVISKCIPLVFRPTNLTVEVGTDLVALLGFQVVALRASGLELKAIRIRISICLRVKKEHNDKEPLGIRTRLAPFLLSPVGQSVRWFPSHENRRQSVRSGWKASFDSVHNVSWRTSNVCALRVFNAFEWDTRHSASDV
jgi:hypothetical protein